MAQCNSAGVSLFRHPFVPVCCLALVSIKCLLIRCYHSTDFEVHRNWMALTHHLPLSDWYRSNVSQWTLDYPPFFAYLEWIFAQFAALADPGMLTLQSNAFFSESTLVFQRLSVIMADLCYFTSCVLLADNFVNFSSWTGATLFRERLKLALCTFLVTNPSLILLDNIHFQYNAFLFGIFLCSLNAIFANRLLAGAFLFTVLLNFKHIFLYYAPAFVAFYLFHFLLPMGRRCRPFFQRIFSLASVIGVVFVASFGPFLLNDGPNAIRHIVSRLFPFKRGLTHACWAPNFWALYNFVDWLLYKIVSKIVPSTANCLPSSSSSSSPLHWLLRLLKQCPPVAPEYTRGLVQEYAHAILPNISPSMTFALILCALVPCFWTFVHWEQKKSPAECFLISLSFASFAFFWFGWHVHEKAILMLFFPLCLLAIKDPTFMPPFALVYVASVLAQFPLLFTPLECLLKWALALWHFVLCQFLANFVWGIRLAEFIQFPGAKFGIVLHLLAEIYAEFGHKLFFGIHFEFLPMMVTSVTCALLLLLAYINLLLCVFAESAQIHFFKFCCRRKERRILNAASLFPTSSSAAAAAAAAVTTEKATASSVLDMDSVKFIAGVDVSQCKNQPQFAVVSLVVQTFPELKVIYVSDEVVLLGQPSYYITEYLAVREAGPIRRSIYRHLKHCPKIQLLFVDGNGRWHSRGCGLACHVGHDLRIATIGMAKNFAPAPLLKTTTANSSNRSRTECQRQPHPQQQQQQQQQQLSAVQQQQQLSAVVECVKAESVNREEEYKTWFKLTQATVLKLALEHCKTVNEAALFVLENASLTATAVVDQLPNLAILRSSTSHVPLFVSSGWGISFDMATKIALECIDQSPIRLSDLRSRAKLMELFEQ